MDSLPDPKMPSGPTTVLIAAIGGEGGGVLADWVVAAAVEQGFPVQSTSIPGVAQRTGATTYYIEIFPVPRIQLNGKSPLLALTPTPGYVDMMVASEFAEAGRAIEEGYVSAGRTVLIASTHRVYSIAEKTAMADGRFDASELPAIAQGLARKTVLFDMASVARTSKTVISSVLFGAMAGSGALPLSRAACEDAIRAGGKGVDASLRGFAAGFEQAASNSKAEVPAHGKIWRGRAVEDVRAKFPEECHRLVEEGYARLIDYQDRRYGGLYLDRLAAILGAERETAAGVSGARVTNSVARYLALWMSYEDVIRVADLKSRRSRLDRVRQDVGARASEPIHVTEFLKPGVDELVSVLPPSIARAVRAWATRNGYSLNVGLHIKTTSVWGMVTLRLLASFKPLRRFMSRYSDEQQLIERWLQAVADACRRDRDLAAEVAELGRLIKGYGDTHRRGRDSFLRILDTLVATTLSEDSTGKGHAMAIRAAREAALADPEGHKLDASLETEGIPPRPIRAVPVRFVRRARHPDHGRSAS